MKFFVLIQTNTVTGECGHVGVFSEELIEGAILVAWEFSNGFTAFHKEEVKYYDSTQKLRETLNARPTGKNA